MPVLQLHPNAPAGGQVPSVRCAKVVMPYKDKEKERANWRKWNRIRYVTNEPGYMAHLKAGKARRKANGKERECQRRSNRKRYAMRHPTVVKWLAEMRRRNLADTAAMGDRYITQLLNGHGPRRKWPKEMIELKRAQLTLKRTNDNHKRTS